MVPCAPDVTRLDSKSRGGQGFRVRANSVQQTARTSHVRSKFPRESQRAGSEQHRSDEGLSFPLSHSFITARPEEDAPHSGPLGQPACHADSSDCPVLQRGCHRQRGPRVPPKTGYVNGFLAF